MIEDNSKPQTTHTWPAPAKLNLFLHITGIRKDGYHLLQTVIQFIDLCDELKFTLRTDSKINFECSDSSISQEDNLVLRAAQLLRENSDANQGADIVLNKVIPSGAGLGGGSSDAATTLLALNQIWDCEFDTSQLKELALQLGADVPVFVHAQACWVSGIGEKIEPIELPEPWYVVIYPNLHLDTKEMFSNPNLTRNCPTIKIRDFALQATQNVFESIARQQSKVERAFQWLNKYSPASLTGSGVLKM